MPAQNEYTMHVIIKNGLYVLLIFLLSAALVFYGLRNYGLLTGHYKLVGKTKHYQT